METRTGDKTHIATALQSVHLSNPVSQVEEFRAAHARIESGLVAAEAVASDPQKLLAQLKTMRADVLSHLKAKDAFYPELAEQCARVGDGAAAHLTNIFSSNMKVQSAAVQRFFETLDTTPAAQVLSSFKTVVTVIRQRFGTEERAVFPIYLRTAKKPEAA
jgi:hypothetical protein